MASRTCAAGSHLRERLPRRPRHQSRFDAADGRHSTARCGRSLVDAGRAGLAESSRWHRDEKLERRSSQLSSLAVLARCRGRQAGLKSPDPLVGQPGSVQLVKLARRRSRITWIEKTRNPPSVSRGGLTLARPVSLPTGRIPFREPPCPGRQVGEGVNPTLDAVPNIISGVKSTSHRPAGHSGAG